MYAHLFLLLGTERCLLVGGYVDTSMTVCMDVWVSLCVCVRVRVRVKDFMLNLSSCKTT